MKQKITIGTHMSIAQGLEKTAENVVKMEADTMQIFSRNPRGSNFRTPTEKETEGFQRIRREHGGMNLPSRGGIDQLTLRPLRILRLQQLHFNIRILPGQRN